MIEVTSYATGDKLSIPLYAIHYVKESDENAIIGYYDDGSIEVVESFIEVISKIKEAELEMMATPYKQKR